jgi:hypothetical protein
MYYLRIQNVFLFEKTNKDIILEKHFNNSLDNRDLFKSNQQYVLVRRNVIYAFT